jgi:hypothetical protein
MVDLAVDFSPLGRERRRVETRSWARPDVLPGLKSGVSGLAHD